MKKRLLALLCILCISLGVYAQSNLCNCYVLKADSLYQYVPMTQGTDLGYPSEYHCDNCSSQPIVLPFNFCFYGKDYDTVFVNNKGNLTFTHPEFKFSSKGFPLGNDTLMLAPFYSDIDDTPQNPVQTSFSGIYYKITPTHLVVQWSIVAFNSFDCDIFNNFQITITNGADPILPAGNNVSYCYFVMQWASGDSSGGNGMGWQGIPATAGVNKGDHVHYAQFGAFDFPGYTYEGPFDTAGQVYWLNDKSLIFNTCVSGNTIPPAIVNPGLCDTITMCAPDTISFPLSFICPQLGQTATITAYSPGLAGLTTTTSNSHSLYSITTQLVAHLRDTGAHVITIKATDNSLPPLSDSIQIKVIIQSCGDTALNLGIKQPAIENSQITIYPNPSDGKFHVLVNSKLSVKKTMQVYNVMGEKISQYTPDSYRGNNSQFTIDLGNQPSGVYFYLLFDESGALIGNGKFVIQQ